MVGHKGFVVSLCFSSDSKLLVSGSYDQTICIWDANTGKILNILVGHTSMVSKVVFTLGDQTLISSDGIVIKFWGRTKSTWVQTGELSSLESAFNCQGTMVAKTQGLSKSNRQLMLQRGAILEASEQVPMAGRLGLYDATSVVEDSAVSSVLSARMLRPPRARLSFAATRPASSARPYFATTSPASPVDACPLSALSSSLARLLDEAAPAVLSLKEDEQGFNLESNRFSRELRLDCQNVLGDGFCFFRAIAKQIQDRNLNDQRHVPLVQLPTTLEEIRTVVAIYFNENYLLLMERIFPPPKRDDFGTGAISEKLYQAALEKYNNPDERQQRIDEFRHNFDEYVNLGKYNSGGTLVNAADWLPQVISDILGINIDIYDSQKPGAGLHTENVLYTQRIGLGRVDNNHYISLNGDLEFAWQAEQQATQDSSRGVGTAAGVTTLQVVQYQSALATPQKVARVLSSDDVADEVEVLLKIKNPV